MRNGAPKKTVCRSHGKTKKRLLFTGGGGAGSEALSRLLEDCYEVHFGDADIEAKPYAVHSKCWHQIPMASAPDFVKKLGSLCRDLGVDLLIPAVDEELMPISRARKTMPCEVLLPPTEFIRVHLDKMATNSMLNKVGLPAPLTAPLHERKCISFPCIVKPRQGRGSRGVAVVCSEQELQSHVVLSRHRPEDFIVQELLVGQEYTVMMAADRTGQLCAVVPVKVGIKKGITLRAETDRDERVIAACVAIHAADPVPGCYNIQLVKTETGDAKPFEINPRISTTSCLGLAAGVNFVDVYLEAKETANSRVKGLLQFQDRLRLRRSWYNEIIA